MAETLSQDRTPPPPPPPTSSSSEQQIRTHDTLESKADQHLHSSHGIEINVPTGSEERPPLPVKHLSAPAYASPIRHHKRVPSRSRAVKETANAQSHYGSQDDDDAGVSVHRINQYVIKQEIGRGSFGAVHLAVDQYGVEYAVKEFSKSRLRKRAQSSLLRQPDRRRRPGQFGAHLGFNSPLHRISPSDRKASVDASKPFELIKEEIAIMKKLNHHNVVTLLEVLDDPQEDTLYMVLEMCKKGIVMKVGLDERAEPYPDEVCRTWFRDMILGIEYLHAQGIIHRDIKPDNCLVTEDGVLKIVDFGVSEMFEKTSPMETAKSAGSPAFMPPELCVAKHGVVSGRPADIWSMGVTLYCLRYGHIPFEKHGMIELYDSIREDDFPLDDERDENFRNLMRRILEKDPEKRITMSELRAHPWVTKNGTDPLLSEEENCAELVEPPTQSELNRAITGNMANLLVVMKAVKRFKARVARKRPMLMESLLGRDAQLVAPPQELQRPRDLPSSRSTDRFDRRAIEKVLVTEGVHRDIDVNDNGEKLPHGMDRPSVVPSALHDEPDGDSFGASGPQVGQLSARQHQFISQEQATIHRRATTFPLDETAKGHAHDPLEDLHFLKIGAGSDTVRASPDVVHSTGSDLIVSESPPGVDTPIYEQAYQGEMQRILAERGEQAAMYLNRRVEHREDLRTHHSIIDRSRAVARTGMQSLQGSSRFADVVKQAHQLNTTGQAVGSVVKEKVGPTGQSVGDTVKEKARPTTQALGDAVKAKVGSHLDALKPGSHSGK